MTTSAGVDDGRVWPAPAKLNLMLRVTGRRDDGYHLLQTVFQFVDLCDELRFQPNASGQIRLLTPQAEVPPEQDLVVRAARLLQVEAACDQGVDILLNKRIPLGGGLGGGSSDAATTLLVLNRLWGLGWDVQRLAGLGLRLGADVPVFVRGRTAWAEGVGERLQPLALPQPWYLLVAPNCQVATGELFAASELTRDAPPITIADFLGGDVDNAFEPLVRRRYPAVDQAMTWLEGYGRARLTGTGATVFLVCSSEQEARQLHGLAQGAGLQAWVARGMNLSPLHVVLSH